MTTTEINTLLPDALQLTMHLSHDKMLDLLLAENGDLYFDPMDECWYRWSDHWKGKDRPCDKDGNYLTTKEGVYVLF